jgi:glycerol-3-phosphate dehydrogenase
MTRGLAEIARFAVHQGGRLLTLAGLAAMGELVVTCASPHSRNYRVGLGLAPGRALPDILRELGMVAEGVCTTRIVRILAEREGVHMPITAALARLRASSTSSGRSPSSWRTRPARRSMRTASPSAERKASFLISPAWGRPSLMDILE